MKLSTDALEGLNFYQLEEGIERIKEVLGDENTVAAMIAERDMGEKRKLVVAVFEVVDK